MTVFGLSMALGSLFAIAATPLAGSLIGNQAAASYTDSSGNQQTATSNLVQTSVQQVGAFSLTSSGTKNAAPGNTVYMPHTLTNSGNGSDTFTLGLTNNAGSFDFSAYSIYLDADGNGLPDTGTPLASGAGTYNTPAIAAGGTFKFVVALTVPGGATNGQSDNVTVSATAGTAALYTTPTATNTDTVNALTSAPVFTVTKSISQSSGGVSAASCTGTSYAGAGCVKVTYTLSYTNNGTASGDLYLKDIIGAGATAGLEYVPGSAKWNTTNTLTDAAGGDPAGVDFQSIGGTVQAVVASVAPGVSGTLTFDAGVKSTAAVGSSTTSNTGGFETATGTTVAGGTPGSTQPTNVAVYTVSASYGVIANNGANTAGVPNDGDNTTATGNDLVSVATAAAGSTVSFTNTVWNTGNSSDTFNVSYGSSTFPSGTTFALFKSDGTTPLTDSNGDGTLDTGPLAAGASTTVIVKATIPGTACASGCPAAPLTVTVTAASVGDSTKTNKVFDSVTTSLTGPTVTLGNGTVAPGVTWDGVSGPVTTLAVNGGATASFDLIVNNTAASGPAETYNLEYSASNFVSGTVPVGGWTVVFRSGTCASAGTVITSVGPVSAGSSANVCAVVTTTSGSAAGTSSVYFRVTSGATGASAVKRDGVTINTVASLTIAPSNTGQVQAGGSVIYAHTLTNTGNVSCPAVTWSISETLAAQGWTAVTYLDVNGDGQLDAGDTVATGVSGALGIGSSQKLLVKVFAPGGAALGATDVLTITATDATCGSGSATDTSTVFSGQLRLQKSQALDAACDGTPDTAFTTAVISAKPGQCLIYQVIATNQGATAVTNVSISDATPTYTTMSTAASCTAGTGSSPAMGATGTAACNGIASIASNGTATLTFGVQIAP